MTRPTWDETWLELARLMAARSRCPSGAGCVIVDAQQRVVATGYTGPPATYRYDLDDNDDGWSPYQDLGDCRAYCHRARQPAQERPPTYWNCPSAHAEINALMFSDRQRVEGGTLYVSSATCGDCMKAVGNSGVVRVVWSHSDADQYRNADLVIAYLNRCRIQVDVIT